MIRRLALTTVLVLALLSGAQRPLAVYADSPTTGGTSIVEQIGCDLDAESRSCQIEDFVNLFVYLSKWGLSILSILSILMFVYGGFQFVTAGGRASKVDEGKRVVGGTIIGIIITLVAYVIINFTVSSVTGYRVVSANPFGPVGAVFGDVNPSSTISGQTLPKSFSGSTSTGSKGTTSGTRSCIQGGTWDFACTTSDKLHPIQVDCADPAGGTGVVTNIQTALTSKGCDCGGSDGCFGPKTVACVRQFQVANGLMPTGVVDETTFGKLQGGASCTSTGNDARVVAALPETHMATSDGAGLGCCIVKSGDKDLYCADNVSTRACQALGSDVDFFQGETKCGAPGLTFQRCGFCSADQDTGTSPATNICFQTATPYWCSQSAQPNFKIGDCAVCGTCINSLLKP